MKQVIFLCLLSLTLSLAKPSDPVTDPKAPKDAVAPTILAGPSQAQTTVKPTNQTVPAANANVNQTAHEETQKPSLSPTDNKTIPKDEKSTQPPTTVATSSTAAHNETAPVKPTQNTTKPEENATKTTSTTSTTTQAPSTPKPHDVPAKPVDPKSDEVQHIVQARGFDGPSFIGGIILTLGLLAIGFMGFKYYKNQTERNYHTL